MSGISEDEKARIRGKSIKRGMHRLASQVCEIYGVEIEDVVIDSENAWEELHTPFYILKSRKSRIGRPCPICLSKAMKIPSGQKKKGFYEIAKLPNT